MQEKERDILLVKIYSEITTLSDNYGSLKKDFSYLKEDISFLKKEVTSLNAKYDSLNKKYDSLNKEVTSLNKKYDSLNQEVASLNKKYDSLNQEVFSLGNTLTRLEFKDDERIKALFDASDSYQKKLSYHDKRFLVVEKNIESIKDEIFVLNSKIPG